LHGSKGDTIWGCWVDSHRDQIFLRSKSGSKISGGPKWHYKGTLEVLWWRRSKRVAVRVTRALHYGVWGTQRRKGVGGWLIGVQLRLSCEWHVCLVLHGIQLRLLWLAIQLRFIWRSGLILNFVNSCINFANLKIEVQNAKFKKLHRGFEIFSPSFFKS
jgi:hypothetical protein